MVTDSPDSAEETTARIVAVTRGSKTIAQCVEPGLVAPSIRVARRTASSAVAATSRPSTPRAAVLAYPVWSRPWPFAIAAIESHDIDRRALERMPVVEASADSTTASP